MIGGYNPWFLQELGRRVEAECSEKAAQLAQGTCADYGGYRAECGAVQGMRRAIEIADEIKREVDRQ